MPDNPHRIVIELAPSNGFSTRNDAHAAYIIQRRVYDAVGTDALVVSVRIDTDKEGTTP